MDILHKINPWVLEFPEQAEYGPFLLVSVVSFAVVAWFLFRVVPKPAIGNISGILDDRKRAIQTASEQVEETLRETEAMRNDYRQRLEKIEDETERRMAEAVREAESLRETILAEAKVNAAAIQRRGEDEVARERAKARVSLRAEFVDDVIQAAEYAASRSLDNTQQSRLVSEFVQNVGAKA